MTRPTFRVRLAERPDEGSSMIVVLVVSMLLMAAVASSAAVSTAGLSFSGSYTSSQQGALAAQSGLNAASATMDDVSTVASLPCPTLTGHLTASGAKSTYTVTVAYYGYQTSNPGTPASLTCAQVHGGSYTITAGTLTSLGKAPAGMTTTMKADVRVQQGTPLTALDYALFTDYSLNLANGANICKTGSTNCAGGTGPSPDIYDGATSGIVTCPNGVLSEGDLTIYQSLAASGACTIDGSAQIEGYVTLANGDGCSQPTIGGSLTAYGVDTNSKDSSYGDGIYMSGNTCVGKSATATDGNINLVNSAAITTSAFATGTIATAGSGSVGGHSPAVCPSSYCTPGDSSGLSGDTMPPMVAWPVIDPSVAAWSAADYNVVQIPGGAYSTCSSYFANYSSGANDPFMNQIQQATEPTVIYAPTCAVTYSRSHVFNLNANIVLEVQSLTLQNSNTFQANSGSGFSSSKPVDLSVLATAQSSCTYSGNISGSPCTTPDGSACTATSSDGSGPCTSPTPCSPSTTPPSGGISAANQTTFSSSVDSLLYTPDVASWGNAPSMTGQILACGGITGVNAFELEYTNNAAASLGSALGSLISVTVSDRYIVSGA